MISRLTYRTRQFWSALADPHLKIDIGALRPYLCPPQIALFCQMQVSEQTHAYQVFRRLQANEQTNPDLLSAALLHDVGKILYPPTVLDRVVVVIGTHFFRRAADGWSKATPAGYRRPFVVAANHPVWGADLARQAGASPHTVELIRQHHDPQPTDDPLVAALKAADDIN